MTPRTLTAPPTDKRYWRRLLRLVHPDSHGDSDLFVWCRNLQEYVASDAPVQVPPHTRREPPKHKSTSERVSFDHVFEEYSDHAALVAHALSLAETTLEQPFADLLRLLGGCFPSAPNDVNLRRQESQGCTYRQAAYTSHLAN